MNAHKGKRFLDGNKWYQEVLDDDENEIEDPLIFFNEAEVDLLRKTKRWMADGTWKACQDSQYEQLWILSSVIETSSKERNHVHPLGNFQFHFKLIFNSNLILV